MALMSCVKCGRNYSDTLEVCPHCHHAPKAFVCPECGGIYGKGDTACANCGLILNHSRRTPATEQDALKAMEEVQKLVEQADNLAQLKEVGKTLDLLASCTDISAVQAIFEEKYDQANKAEDFAIACNLVENAKTISELNRAEMLLKNLGDYEGAAEKLEQCGTALNNCKMTVALSVMNNAKSVVDLENAGTMFRELATYGDASLMAVECDAKIKKLHKSKKTKRLVTLLSIAAVVLAIAVAISVFTFFIPNSHYSNANKLFASENFSEAAQEYLAAGDFKDAAQKAEDANAMAAKKQNYEAAQKALEAGNFQDALTGLQAAVGYRDADALLTDVGYNYGMMLMENKEFLAAAQAFGTLGDFSDAKDQIFICGNALLDAESYAEAAEAFNLMGTDQGSAYCTYANAMTMLANKEYMNAVSLFEAVLDVEDAATRVGECYYKQGKKLLDKGDYKEAKSYFKKAGDYKGAKKMINACILVEAETYWKKGHLNTAQSLYKKLPSDFKYDGVSVSKRLSLLKKFSAYVKLCGKWQAKGDCKATVRQIYKRTGSWDEWTTTFTNPKDYVTITCTISDKGKLTMKGTVSYDRHTKYSTLSSLLRTTGDSASFKYSTTKNKVPSKIKISGKENLSISGSKFTLKYSYTNKNESINFNYKYTSTWKYSKRIEKY